MTVSRVDVHHEGGGSPTADGSRYEAGGYVAGLGLGQFQIFRTAAENWATKHFNHVDVAVCFSGNRMVEPITDDDIRSLRALFVELRRRGEVVDHPDVHPHGTLYTAPGGNLPGSSPTQCPGLLTLQRWPEIVAACQANSPAPVPTPPPVPLPGFKPTEGSGTTFDEGTFHVKHQLVTCYHKGFGLYEGAWDTGLEAPTIISAVTLGPAVSSHSGGDFPGSSDDWWAPTLGFVPRAQTRAKWAVVTGVIGSAAAVNPPPTIQVHVTVV